MEGLGATYDDHLRLIGKSVLDLLLVLIELLSLSVTAEALQANIGSKSAISLQRDRLTQKFQVEGVSSRHKTRVNGFSCGIRIRAQLSFILSQFTRLTDGNTEFSSLDRVCIPCSAVKINDVRSAVFIGLTSVTERQKRQKLHLKNRRSSRRQCVNFDTLIRPYSANC